MTCMPLCQNLQILIFVSSQLFPLSGIFLTLTLTFFAVCIATESLKKKLIMPVLPVKNGIANYNKVKTFE